MVIYFTGTGNSEYCAKAFAQTLGDEAVNSFDAIKAQVFPAFHSEKPWVFCAPTYAWQLPRLFAQWLEKCTFTGCTDAYFVMTCGDDIGQAGAKIAAMCKRKGLRFRGVLEVVMPENYIAMFNVPKPSTQLKIIANAQPSIRAGIECVRKGVDFPPYKASLVQKLKTHIVNPVFYAACVKAKDFYATDACIGCGKCEKVCVCSNIQLQNGKPVWGKECTHCMACICKCPKQAIEYADKSRGKPRYTCPSYQPDEGQKNKNLN